MNDSGTQLDIIYRMMSEFTSSADINRTLYRGLDYICTEINAEAASFFYLYEARAILRCEACIGPSDITGLELPARRGIIGAVAQSDVMRFVPDVAKDSDFSPLVDTQTGFETKSMICVPVSGNGKKYGAIQLINRRDGTLFSPTDAALVSVYGKSAALALTNSQLTAHMLEADALKRDLAMASRVQESLFPKQTYPYIYGMNVPKKGVSGDLFDYVIRDGQVFFCMADVSGKGTDAALVMAKTHSLFRSLSRNTPSPAMLATMMNRELTETSFDGMFVTAIIGAFDPVSGAMACCNAGHEPGLIINSDSSFDYVPASVQPLGIVDFACDDIVTQKHDLSDKRFFCYSDGITEAEIDGQMVGAVKLAEMLSKQMDLPLRRQIENTMCNIQQRATILQDDLTLLGLGLGQDLGLGLELERATPEKNAEKNMLFSLSMRNEMTQLRHTRRALQKALANTAAQKRIDDVQLAVSEALQNIIRHAFDKNQIGHITLSGHIANNMLHICIIDTAPMIDLARIKPRPLDAVREGGLGTHFIMTLAEQANWSHDDKKRNRLDMRFTL